MCATLFCFCVFTIPEKQQPSARASANAIAVFVIASAAATAVVAAAAVVDDDIQRKQAVHHALSPKNSKVSNRFDVYRGSPTFLNI